MLVSYGHDLLSPLLPRRISSLQIQLYFGGVLAFQQTIGPLYLAKTIVKSMASAVTITKRRIMTVVQLKVILI